MEQHPVPRNITGFQFHLIGDMTVKQFGYLLGGFIFGLIFVKIPLPNFIGWPIGVGCALTGIGFAFVPIQERPLDRWMVAFIKSITSPTQYLWRKTNEPPAILTAHLARIQPVKKLNALHMSQSEQSRRALRAYLSTLPRNAKQAVDTEESGKLFAALALFQTPPPKPRTPTMTRDELPPFVFTQPSPQATDAQPSIPFPKQKPPPQKAEAEATNEEVLAKKSEGVDSQIVELQRRLSEQTEGRERFKELEKQLTGLLAEKDRLSAELVKLRQQLAQKPKEDVVRPTSFVHDGKTEETVKIIKPDMASRMGFPNFPSIPNLISGIIKDRQNIFLPNILVTIKDTDDTPVRALKSNNLGQFGASTPLPKGVYTIEFDDPQKKYTFAIIEITLTGDLVTPLEILAKSQKELHREQLMREIFGKTQ